MKKLFTLLLLSIFLIPALEVCSQKYSRIKLKADKQQIELLRFSGLLTERIFQDKKGEWTTDISEQELDMLIASGLDIDILIHDLSSFYEERNQAFQDEKAVQDALTSTNMEWPVPEDFELGSVGGFCSIDEVIGHLNNMITKYPDLISPMYTMDSLTIEGRTVYWVRISDNPGTNESGEPEVLFTGMHHAREVISMQLLLYYMYYLLENYDTDETVQYLVNNFELVFVPIINMDGYAYNIKTYPDGGGMWRKNRRDNGDGYFGVDPNRNYGYEWGHDNSGSSPYTSDITYRGPYPFSEPCVFNMRNFCEANEFRIALNYHSYGNLLLYSWGYTDTLCPDDDIFSAHGKIMTRENGYEYGAGSTTIYPTNGGSDDWMYGEQDTKDLIYSYTPEVGGSFDGHWASMDRIIPLCQENMYQNVMAVKLAGVYSEVTDESPLIIEELSGDLEFEVRRYGLLDGGTFTVTIIPVNNAITEIGDPVVFTGLDILEPVSGSISYTLDEGISPADKIIYILTIDNGTITESDTITKVYGNTITVFEDPAESFINWSSDKWNITTAQSYSPDNSIADSPYGEYDNLDNNSIILTNSIDLTSTAFAVLNYYAMWDIEAGYDYVQVMAADNVGSPWIPLGGKFTNTGTAYQATGESLYDGVQTEWVREEISLEQFCGTRVNLRFKLKSDTYVTGDGFYWDDMIVKIIDMTTGLGEDNFRSEELVEVFPNPASDVIHIALLDPNSSEDPDFSLYSADGKMVLHDHLISGGCSQEISIVHLQKGLYIYRITGRSYVLTGKIMVR